MKINPGLPAASVAGAAGPAQGSGRPAPGAGAADRVEVSARARSAARLRAAVASAPEDPARAARLERIRQAVEAGTYHVPARQVADALLRSGAVEP